jgi:hypothetical protein
VIESSVTISARFREQQCANNALDLGQPAAKAITSIEYRGYGRILGAWKFWKTNFWKLKFISSDLQELFNLVIWVDVLAGGPQLLQGRQF